MSQKFPKDPMPSGKFMAHILGLDDEIANSRSAASASGPAGQSLTGNLFQSIKFTPAFMFSLVFVGLILLLFVVFSVRHAERPDGSVQATPAGQPASPEAAAPQPVPVPAQPGESLPTTYQSVRPNPKSNLQTDRGKNSAPTRKGTRVRTIVDR